MDVAIGDLDGDGNVDLVVTNSYSADVALLLGIGDGTFDALQRFPVGGAAPTSVAIGDLDGDGNPDLVVPKGSSEVSVLLNQSMPCDACDMNCDGDINAFDIEPFLELLFGGGEPCAPCTGDVDGDGEINAFDIEPFLECLFP